MVLALILQRLAETCLEQLDFSLAHQHPDRGQGLVHYLPGQLLRIPQDPLVPRPAGEVLPAFAGRAVIGGKSCSVEGFQVHAGTMNLVRSVLFLSISSARIMSLASSTSSSPARSRVTASTSQRFQWVRSTAACRRAGSMPGDSIGLPHRVRG